jgi:hypothetical protein
MISSLQFRSDLADAIEQKAKDGYARVGRGFLLVVDAALAKDISMTYLPMSFESEDAPFDVDWMTAQLLTYDPQTQFILIAVAPDNPNDPDSMAYCQELVCVYRSPIAMSA